VVISSRAEGQQAFGAFISPINVPTQGPATATGNRRMQQPEKVRAAFERDLGNKVLFIKDGKLLFIKGIKLKAIADRAAYFAKLRSRQAQPIVILAELPPEQAFDLWKQHVLGDKPD
jgi:hypothetical protein